VDEEAALADLHDDLLREQFGRPCPPYTQRDHDIERFYEANEATCEAARLRRKPRPLP